MIIKLYGFPLNHLDEKDTDFNFTEIQFCTQDHSGDI